MRLLLLLLCTSVIVTSYAQSSFEFGVTLVPNIPQQDFESSDLFEGKSQLSVDAQILVGRQIGERWRLETGLMYSLMNLELRDYSPTFGCDHDGQGNVLIENSWIEDDISLHYVGIPLMVGYDFLKGEDVLDLMIGAEYLLDIGESINSQLVECQTMETDLEDNELTSPSDYQARFVTGLRYTKRLSDARALSFAAVAKFGLNDIFEETAIVGGPVLNGKVTHFGLAIGYWWGN